jgi:hypothetical protein
VGRRAGLDVVEKRKKKKQKKKWVFDVQTEVAIHPDKNFSAYY